MEGFQVTLPSNASSNSFPDNKPSRYQTLLVAPLQLEGAWEVALVDVVYPYTMVNFPKEMTMKLLRKKDDFVFKEIKIKPQYFKSTQDLCSCLNSSLNEMASKEAYTKCPVEFIFDIIDQSISVVQKWHWESVYHVAFSDESMAKFLGIELKPSAKFNRYFGLDVPTESTGLGQLTIYPLIFFYTDILQYQIVGDIKAPLLGVVPVTGSWGDQVYWNFSPLTYIPLANNNISTIEIRLCTETGDPFPIKGSGKVIVRLNFRRRAV